MKIGNLEIATENKALILLSAQASKKEHLLIESKRAAAWLIHRMDSQNKKVAVMERLDMDPFRLVSKAPGYDVTMCRRRVRRFRCGTGRNCEHLAKRSPRSICVGCTGGK